jgi:hypothetical protein
MRFVVLALCLVGCATPAAVADPITVTQTLTFEGIPNDGDSVLPPLDSHGGLTWQNFSVTNTVRRGYPLESGYVNGTISGDFVAFNSGGDPAGVLGSTPFTFNSAYFTAGLEHRSESQHHGLCLKHRRFLPVADTQPLDSIVLRA